MSERSILAQIAELAGLDRRELCARWQELFGGDAPGYSKEMLAARLAYRVQELAYGGLPDTVRDELADHLPDGELGEGKPRMRRRKRSDSTPIVGTRLVREFGGHRYEVTVVADGFELLGRRYRSLTAAAKAICGTSVSGPKFFGLRSAGKDG